MTFACVCQGSRRPPCRAASANESRSRWEGRAGVCALRGLTKRALPAQATQRPTPCLSSLAQTSQHGSGFAAPRPGHRAAATGASVAARLHRQDRPAGARLHGARPLPMLPPLPSPSGRARRPFGPPCGEDEKSVLVTGLWVGRGVGSKLCCGVACWLGGQWRAASLLGVGSLVQSSHPVLGWRDATVFWLFTTAEVWARTRSNREQEQFSNCGPHTFRGLGRCTPQPHVRPPSLRHCQSCRQR